MLHLIHGLQQIEHKIRKADGLFQDRKWVKIVENYELQMITQKNHHKAIEDTCKLKKIQQKKNKRKKLSIDEFKKKNKN